MFYEDVINYPAVKTICHR